MATDIPVSCECGDLEGVAREVSAANKNHVVCYCDDCQLFAHYLGRANDILDPHGGTDILQMSPAHLRIDKGADRVACLRLRPKGLFRWYTECCKTPIGNTLPTSKVPYLGMVTHLLLRSLGDQERENALGEVQLRVHTRFAKGDVSGARCHERIPLIKFFPLAGKLIRWRLQGGMTPSSFFNEKGKPVSEPHILAGNELNEAISSRMRWMEGSQR